MLKLYIDKPDQKSDNFNNQRAYGQKFFLIEYIYYIFIISSNCIERGYNLK